MSTSVDRPAGITCVDWKPREPGKKRCAFYLPPDPARGEVGALCNLSQRFLCEEWEKANARLIPEARLRAVQKTDPAAAAASQPVIPSSASKTPPSPPPSPATQAELFSPPRTTIASPASAPPHDAPPAAAREIVEAHRAYRPAKEIPPADIEALEKLGAEICLTSKALGDREIWLVPKRTGIVGRFEITFREAATLRLITDAFPGARVTDLRSLGYGAEAGKTGTLCPDCKEPQYRVPESGITCPNGHGFGDPSNIRVLVQKGAPT